MAEKPSWPENLLAAIELQSRIEETDPEQLIEGTVPNIGASEAEIAAFESMRGERLPVSYREFLLHANGWEASCFMIDLFGLQELHGGGRWQRAQDLFSSYEAEEVLEDSGLEATDLLPVAAGQGADLIVLVRQGRPRSGTAIWFDGGEFGRYEDFSDFFRGCLKMFSSWIARQEGALTGAEDESPASKPSCP